MTDINNKQSIEKYTNIQQSVRSRLNLIHSNLEVVRTYLSIVDKAMDNNDIDMAYSYTTLAGERLETTDNDIKKIVNALACYSIKQSGKDDMKKLDRSHTCDHEKCSESACRYTTAKHSLAVKETKVYS